MEKRANSIDILRGAAVIMMVFSGMIPFAGTLPVWMYHAQVPPPAHHFNPNLAGLTWVDLVFPFFLFSMGAVVPFALPSKLAAVGVFKTLQQTLFRSLKLLIFAVVTWQFHPWRCDKTLGDFAPFIGILTYIGFFLAFVKLKNIDNSKMLKINILGWFLIISAGVIIAVSGKKINPAENDSIIRVLANVYFVGIGIWILTRHNWALRLGIALVFLTQYLGGSTEGTWMRWLWKLSDPWNLTSLMLLKYLLIFIPGTLIGDILSEKTPDSDNFSQKTPENAANTEGSLFSFLVTFGLTSTTLVGLLSRQVELTFGIVLLFLAAAFSWIFLRKNTPQNRHLWTIGALLLVAGFCAEPFQGGIKKDNATLSYFLITSGLATFWLWSLHIFTAKPRAFFLSKIVEPIRLTGQNPLMAYAMAGFLIVPLMTITHFNTLFNDSAPLGVVKAVFITGSMVALTAFFSKKKIFWKL